MKLVATCIIWRIFWLEVGAIPVEYAPSDTTEYAMYTEKDNRRWALLVAGSKGYGNYRHQADVCHAYQILRSRGFDESRIITMFYDDVAHSFFNPYKSKLFNDVRIRCLIYTVDFDASRLSICWFELWGNLSFIIESFHAGAMSSHQDKTFTTESRRTIAEKK